MRCCFSGGYTIRWKVLPCEHFVDQDTERPPVHALPVAFIKNHLGCNVLRSAAHCVRPKYSFSREKKSNYRSGRVVPSNNLLCEAKIRQLYVSYMVQEEVLRLQNGHGSVGDAVAVSYTPCLPAFSLFTRFLSLAYVQLLYQKKKTEYLDVPVHYAHAVQVLYGE